MEQVEKSHEIISINEMAAFLLDAGVFLMSSGAHSGRVWRNCKRMAAHWGFEISINPTYTGMLLTVWDENNPDNAVTRYKSSPPSSIHMAVLSEISRLTWQIKDGDVTFAAARQALEEIRVRSHYPFGIVALAVGFSCGLLAMLAGGNIYDALIALAAASTGSLVRYFILLNKFNNFLSVIIAAFVSSFIAGLDTIFRIGSMPEIALATSVLYLIPGVPLLNSVIDLLEGYFSASLARSLFSASVLLCIAIGMTITIMLLGISNF